MNLSTKKEKQPKKKAVFLGCFWLASLELGKFRLFLHAATEWVSYLYQVFYPVRSAHPPESHLGLRGTHSHRHDPRSPLAAEIIAPVARRLPLIVFILIVLVVGKVEGSLVGACHHFLVDADPGPDEGAHAADQAGNLPPRGGRDDVVSVRVDGAAERVLEAGDGHVRRSGGGIGVWIGRGGGAVGANPNVAVDAQDHVDLAAPVAGAHGPDLPSRSHHPAASAACAADGQKHAVP